MNENGLLARARVRVIGRVHTWLRPLALLSVVAASCGEPGNSAPSDTLGKSQEAVINEDAPLGPGERRTARSLRVTFGHATLPALGFSPVPSIGSGESSLFFNSTHPSSGYWIAHKNSSAQGELVTHLLKSKVPPAISYDGQALRLAHSLFVPTGQVGPGGVVAMDPPGLTSGQGFVQPSPQGGALLNPVLSSPSGGTNGTRRDWTTGPADTGTAVMLNEDHQLRVPVIRDQVLRESILFEIMAYVPSHPERAGAVVGNAIRPLLKLHRNGSEIVNGGMIRQSVDFSSVLDQWTRLQVRLDLTTSGGSSDASSDDWVRARYSVYLHGELVRVEEPSLSTTTVQTASGPVYVGFGLATLRGWQGDAPEGYFDEMHIYRIANSGGLAPGESLGTALWSETFGSQGDNLGSSLNPQFKFIHHQSTAERSVRLYDPTNTQKSGSSVIAYKGTAANTELITQHIPHFAPGENCSGNPPPPDCVLPNGNLFDGTAMWISHSRFLPSQPNTPSTCVSAGGGAVPVSPPPIGCASAPALGKRYDGTDVTADAAAYVRPTDANLIQLQFTEGVSNRQTVMVSADVYVPQHVGGHEWLRIVPFAQRGPHLDPTWSAGLSIGPLGFANRWFRLAVRATVTTHGGGPGTADDKADVFLQYIADGQTSTSSPFAGVYVNLDNIAKQGTGNLKFGVSYGIVRGWQYDALEAFIDNVVVQPVEGAKICDEDTDCASGQVCGVDNGAAFGHPGSTRVCWPTVCATAAATNCGNLGAACGLCQTGTECTADADCQLGHSCRENSGRHYGKPYSADVCAPEICEMNPVAGGCGATTSPCGECDAIPKACLKSADCTTPEVCGVDNGDAFGLPGDGDYCWAPVCNDSATTTAHCGTTESECGLCDCRANCAVKSCGDDPSDGCGGECAGLCDSGEVGCSRNLDCPKGEVCIVGAGPQKGGPMGTNACLPPVCLEMDPAQPACGVGSTDCGPCPSATPDCSDSLCGNDGALGSCGTAPSGTFCAVGAPRTIYDPSADRSEGFPLPLPVVDDAMPAGTLPGSFVVADNGTANYAVPIQVPPSAGVSPTLSLNYTSTKANGMLGVGWSLGGLSSIGRCPRTVAQDGIAAAVELTADDRFCLDGQRIILQSSPGVTYGAPSDLYRTELESFSKIELIGSGYEGGQYVGPRGFKVWRKDGTVLWYGTPEAGPRRAGRFALVTSGGVARIWGVTRAEDPAGHTMTIDYSQSTAGVLAVQSTTHTTELLPQTISYGGHGEAYDRFVRFKYSRRTDPLRHYVAGRLMYSKHLLTSIETEANGRLIHRYRLHFPGLDTPETETQARLQSVRLCAPRPGSGEACLPPTQFNYGTADIVTAAQEAESPFPTQLYPSVVIVLDADGDGRDDLLTGKDWRLVRSAEGTSDSLSVVEGPDPERFPFPAPPSAQDEPQCISQASVADLNLDGRDDVTDLCTGRVYFSELDSGSSGVRFTVQFEPTISPPGDSRLVDVDGDGIKELLACGTEFWGTGPGLLHRGPFGHFGSSGTTILPSLASRACFDLQIADLDGNGSDDIFRMRQSQVEEPTVLRVAAEGGTWIPLHIDDPIPWSQPVTRRPNGFHSRLHFLDLNGDNLPDMITYPQPYDGAELIVGLNTGRGFVTRRAALAGEYLSPSYLDDSVAYDMDGDGREELVYATPFDSSQHARRWVVRYLPRGEFEVTLENLEFPFPHNNAPLSLLADIDGDGARELVGRPSSGGTAWLPNGRTAQAGLLERITDGIGKRIKILYQSAYSVQGPPKRTYVSVPQTGPDGTSLRRLNRVAPLVSQHQESQLADGATIAENPGVTFQ